MDTNSVRVQGGRPDILGWGADLDLANRPAVPMEHMPPRLGAHPDHIEQQPVHMKVFHSVERPGITPLFGTSTPPSGLSGMIREAAYQRSENDLRHWLMLLLAASTWLKDLAMTCSKAGSRIFFRKWASRPNCATIQAAWRARWQLPALWLGLATICCGGARINCENLTVSMCCGGGINCENLTVSIGFLDKRINVASAARACRSDACWLAPLRAQWGYDET
jgi:hypothetical protein